MRFVRQTQGSRRGLGDAISLVHASRTARSTCGLIARAGSRLRAQVADPGEHAERFARQSAIGRPADVLAHLAASVAEHDAIVEAAEAGDGELCSRAGGSAAGASRLTVMATIDPAFEPSSLRLAIRKVPGASRPLAAGPAPAAGRRLARNSNGS